MTMSRLMNHRSFTRGAAAPSEHSSGFHQCPQPHLPRLCLHVCCGVCASVALERLLPRFHVLPYWYNPNIFPPQEHDLRLAAAAEVCRHFGCVFYKGPEDFSTWREAVRGFEAEVEGGERCKICFRFRLVRAAAWAVSQNCQFLTTTLTVGPRKPVSVIHEVGRVAASDAGLTWLDESFRRGGGFQRAAQLAAALGIYRQNYCGCQFSLAERNARRSS
jgi:predicted adenine nucleotide alpha hydrolase (AANH) superfamily ATPase